MDVAMHTVPALTKNEFLTRDDSPDPLENLLQRLWNCLPLGPRGPRGKPLGSWEPLETVLEPLEKVLERIRGVVPS